MGKPTRVEIPEHGPGRFGVQGGTRETPTGKEAPDNPQATGAGGAGGPPNGGEGTGGDRGGVAQGVIISRSGCVWLRQGGSGDGQNKSH